MTLGEVERALAPHRLAVMGAATADHAGDLPDGVATLVMIGPAAADFWAHVTAQPEFHDTRPDPLDRWSTRVLNGVAADMGAAALFPFGGPPWHPFIGWALATGRAWVSPVGLLVHDTAGLFVSYRGALGFARRFDLPATGESPCATCATQPCRNACPVYALTPDGYDVPVCRAYLNRPQGRDCMDNGCAVRRACPVSATARRTATQSAFHMQAFSR
ncbi:ferredoxin [Oceaniglobus indicus]|uniref:ferredoxin n=1 Tax=Oceaniglobus indicus TaxID=2047749 RepID=UPI001F4E508D|nr:ferredoxin [Oceaniglobus indicus]